MSRTLFLSIALIPIFLIAAGGAAPAQEEVPLPVAEPPDEADSKAALELVDEIAKEVEEARGLEFKKPFLRKILSPEQVKEFALKKLKDEFPADKLEGLTALYARLGFFPRGIDIADTMGTFLEAGAGGMYDPKTETLYLVRGFSPESSRPILYHEIVHALEDQHFGLNERMRAHQDDSDRASGVQGVVEGSAQFMMDLYVAANPELKKALMADMMAKAGQQMKMIQEVPVVLVAGAGIYPYGNAPAFVKEVTGGEVEKIAALYENMPVSTEQVLHPEKYGPAGDFPYRVELPDLSEVLPEGWEGGFMDSIGELQVAVLLNEFLGGANLMKLMRMMTMDNRLEFRGETKVASEGWDGDRAVVYVGKEGEIGVVWASRWDSEGDAGEFAAAYEKGAAYKEKALGLLSKGGRIEVRGDRVLVVEGFPENLAEKIATAAWEGTKFTPDPRDEADVPPNTEERK